MGAGFARVRLSLRESKIESKIKSRSRSRSCNFYLTNEYGE